MLMAASQREAASRASAETVRKCSAFGTAGIAKRISSTGPRKSPYQLHGEAYSDEQPIVKDYVRERAFVGVVLRPILRQPSGLWPKRPKRAHFFAMTLPHTRYHRRPTAAATEPGRAQQSLKRGRAKLGRIPHRSAVLLLRARISAGFEAVNWMEHFSEFPHGEGVPWFHGRLSRGSSTGMAAITGFPAPGHGLRPTYREIARHRDLPLGPSNSITFGVRRSTLADANERRDWRIHAALAQRLITQARTLYVDEELGWT